MLVEEPFHNLRLIHDREAIFQTEGVRQSPEGTVGAEEIPAWFAVHQPGGCYDLSFLVFPTTLCYT
ncbi:MAG: hypothetical protein K2P65_01360 [Lachnospiraceae bacterium]|nr:hypothetical protein [Lachnospiraceae bacterium]